MPKRLIQPQDQAARRARRRGSILILAMIVLIVLAGMVLSLSRSMRTESASSGNRLSGLKATAIERAAEQFVISNVDGTEGDAVSICSIPGQAIPVGDGYFWLLRPNGADYTNFDFGITDECSKLSLNYATDDEMINLPNMTQVADDSLVNWRDPNGGTTGQGATSGDYQNLTPDPYSIKNANLETVEETLLILGFDKTMLYGQDLNHNGVIDASENAVASSTGGGSGGAAVGFNGNGVGNDPRGLFPFVTVYTVEPNTDPNGNPRVNVNGTNSRQALQQLLLQTLSQSRVTQVLSATGGTGSRRQYSSIVAWYQASGLQPSEFGPIAAYLTTTSATTLNGLININTAPEQVLLCLPGLQQSDADSIVASRASNSGGVTGVGGAGTTFGNAGSSNGSANGTPPNSDLTWLFQAVTPQTAASIAPYITTRSFQYSADIVAVSGDGRSFRRERIVIDARNSPPQILYRKDLTSLGWPLPPEVRKAMQSGQPPPLIQSTAGAGLSPGL